jgi:hypothetical protein
MDGMDGMIDRKHQPVLSRKNPINPIHPGPSENKKAGYGFPMARLLKGKWTQFAR